MIEGPDGRNERPVVLVVDDTPDNLALMSGILGELYKVKVANNAEKALAIAATEPKPDLVLLDVMMPGMDGYEVCRRLKLSEATRNIPVLFLTAKADVLDEKRGLDLGAVDYISKPVSPPIVLARVRNHLQLKVASDFLHDQNAYLEEILEHRTREVHAVQEVTIQALASLAETRDNETGNHLRRTQHYVQALMHQVKVHPRFSLSLSNYYMDLVFKSAPLHDIGKVGIPDRILLKPFKLDPEEFEIMKTHTLLGWEALVSAETSLGSSVAFLQVAKEITLSHHECWDGSGYPQALVGDQIPLSARFMAVADVYDALISQRIYKTGYPHDVAVEMIKKGHGTHFDPDITDAFLEIHQEFRNISQRFQDGKKRSDQDTSTQSVPG